MTHQLVKMYCIIPNITHLGLLYYTSNSFYSYFTG